jgi:ribosomal protein S18 acetylase RimI-like enzyme
MSLDTYPKTVRLKGNRTAVIRPLQKDDFERLLSFFRSLPDDGRMYLRHDVTDPELIRKWTAEMDLEHVIPLVAVEGDTIAADGTLHIASRGWARHVGHIRLVVGPSHRRLGVGTVIARELVDLAEERKLEKLQAHVIENNIGAVRMFERLGFEKAAVLKDMVKDQNGRNQNLAVMINDVARLSQIMEDWIQDSMMPAYRAPGEGYS